MTPPRDSNHTFRFYALKLKRLSRDYIRDDLLSLWNASVDTINAIARTLLGVLATFFGIAAVICNQWKRRWNRNNESNKTG